MTLPRIDTHRADDAPATSPFLDIQPTSDRLRWRLPIVERLCVGFPGKMFLFGGAGLGAAITALERSAGRPTVWATAQYVSYARPGETLEVQVDLVNHGNAVTQARAVGRVDEREIFSVSSALGARPGELSQQWVRPPEAPPPDRLPPASHWREADDDLHSRLDVRVVHGQRGYVGQVSAPSPDGRLVSWVAARDGHPVDASLLAVIADLVPGGVANAVGRNAGGNSLDNTLRINRLIPTRWVLSDIQIVSVDHGFVQGQARLFAEDGTLLATANQTMILRIHDRAPPAR